MAQAVDDSNTARSGAMSRAKLDLRGPGAVGDHRRLTEQEEPVPHLLLLPPQHPPAHPPGGLDIRDLAEIYTFE
jgi:hypothetical protein